MISKRGLFFKYLAPTSNEPVAIEVEKAEGCYLYSPDGKVYLDIISGISVCNLGHNNPSIVEAVKNQVEKHMHVMVYGEYIQEPQVRLAELLCSALPGNLNSVFYSNSGSEAVEGAIKLARRYTGRSEIIGFTNAYHGSTMGALSLIGDKRMSRPFRPLVPLVKQIDFGCFEALKEISGKTACVIIEPVQGEAGIEMPPEGYLYELRRVCSQNEVLLIFDEVQTGFGRTGSLFAMDLFGVTPDIVVFAKGFGGGMPLSSFVSSAEIMSSLSYNPVLGHITTFGGHPVSCAAGLASLKYIIENDVPTHVNEMGNLLKQNLVHKQIKEVRGIGLLMAVELESAEKVRTVIRNARELGLLTDWFLFRENSIRISPPLIISKEECLKACDILNRAIDLS